MIQAKRALRSAFLVSLAAIAANPKIAVSTKATNPTAITTSTSVNALHLTNLPPCRSNREPDKMLAGARIEKHLVLRQDPTLSEATWGVDPFTAVFREQSVNGKGPL